MLTVHKHPHKCVHYFCPQRALSTRALVADIRRDRLPANDGLPVRQALSEQSAGVLRDPRQCAQ